MSVPARKESTAGMPADKRVHAADAALGKAGAGSARKKAATGTRPSPATAKRNDPGAFGQIVSGAPLGGFAAVQSIREGYPAAILKAASRFFGVTDARIQAIAQVPASTASRLEKSAARIDAAATERLYRMGTVTRMAIDVFEDEAAAVEWMRQPNRAFDNTAPLDLMDTEPGAVSVRQVLNAIATGGVA
ncbi:putative toxin-antitoxin system antitoxin component, TIGR02293 family [Noviherbaspirillum suwonense]|uniref:Toxin-antitoxin system antitoxin component, TIGR02293 family n=2 Tax=Noviherbaspirillum suwonense TaxID=1224511 RepID=A0ABY1Q9L9_9BURK|nr:putative toxin-antitoxin system antitoxin component, TIGR02293 family [Noviherbaspirillum suwonense]